MGIVRTIPLRTRRHKVSLSQFGKPCRKGGGFRQFTDSLPRVLAAEQLRGCAEAILRARARGKPVIAGMGGHVVKCGLSRIIIALMRRGAVSALAMNGSVAIHDFEIALIGKTSEDVQSGLDDGTFGMARETGEMMNEAVAVGLEEGRGAGGAIGSYILRRRLPHRSSSLLAEAARLRLPATVHIAIGTDIIHQHPRADGAVLGKASLEDFRTLIRVVSRLGGGGVYLNLGSAVIMPEVFLKALTVARNSGRKVRNFTTAAFDMNRHYRVEENVVRRPVAKGGKGYFIIGHHEIMIPLLARMVIEKTR